MVVVNLNEIMELNSCRMRYLHEACLLLIWGKFYVISKLIRCLKKEKTSRRADEMVEYVSHAYTI